MFSKRWEAFYIDRDLKFKIISEGLSEGISPTCKKYNISRTLYYRWLNRYKSYGVEGLDDIKKNFIPTNKTSLEIELSILKLIKQYPDYGPKYLKYLFEELGYKISESAIFNIMKRHNLTNKDSRHKYAKDKESKITETIPTLSKLSSGECWLFWITDCGNFNSLGQIYEYTLYDFKSRIACTRLYKDINFQNFEDILTSTAMPVAKTLNLSINYLVLFQEDKILKQSNISFYKKVNKVIYENGFDFNVHILASNYEDLNIINSLKKNYTEGISSFLIPLINKGTSFDSLKLMLQNHIRNYNINIKSDYYGEPYTPIDYHNKITKNKTILPIWAYINREY